MRLKWTKRIQEMSVLALLLATYDASALSSYVNRIPNGAVNSCINCHGPDGPPLNAFGDAFDQAGRAWSAALATMDSDGDGFTNGQELADPTGAWRPGQPNPVGDVFLPGNANSHPTVGTAPVIVTQPLDQTVTEGADITFTVSATGTEPLTYQWQKDGANISGATQTSLTLTAVTSSSEGDYMAIVRNSAGFATSRAATLTVVTTPVAPGITTQPASQTVTEGASVTFRVAATGTAPLSYQWQKDGANVGGDNPTLTLNSVSSADAGSYNVTVANTAGSVTSSTATLTVNPAQPGGNQPPFVRIVTPRNGQIFSGSSSRRILISAVAGDVDGSVTTVEFFSGTTSLGNGTAIRNDDNDGDDDRDGDGDDDDNNSSGTVAYVLVWRNVAPGPYTLTAVATDNLGASVRSAPVQIVVRPRQGGSGRSGSGSRHD